MLSHAAPKQLGYDICKNMDGEEVMRADVARRRACG